MLKNLLPEGYGDRDALRTIGDAQADALGPRIRVLVWNILKARRSQFAPDFAALVADRDLVLLQESVLNSPSDALFEGGELEWIMARSFRVPRTGVEHGVKTGCVAPADAANFYRSPHHEPVARTRKLLLVTQYQIKGPASSARDTDTVLVLNMHAINFVGVSKYLKQLDQLAHALATHTGPVILAGDFNTWSVRRRDSFFALASAAALQEVALERRSRVNHLAMHLDHVFSRGLEVREAHSHGEITSSDHAPITVTFDVI